ncbi:MAG: sigma-70 family RNA polymerase sigma factor [Planctomycetia bacterium]|nr:sigma-70 family RNA polymerase sigma factor [Planctomycetia bacterium]
MTDAEAPHEAEPSGDALQRTLAAARQGDDDAFGRLFELFRRHLLLLAQRELPQGLRGKLGPSDVVQETAIDARRNFPGFRGATAEECYAWLRSILRNNVVDAVRRYETAQKRQTTREISLASESGLRLGRLVPIHRGEPDGSAIRHEDAATLTRLMARLPPDYRDVLHLRYWDGLSFVQIAERIGRSADAVRKLWYRAIGRLQEEMTHESSGLEAASGSSDCGRGEQVVV